MATDTVLLWQADSRNLDFRSLMIGAVQRGLARSRSIDELKAWVESIPEPSTEQKAVDPSTEQEAVEPSPEQKGAEDGPGTAGAEHGDLKA